MRAEAAGMISCKEVRWNDRRWWRRLNAILSELESAEYVEVQKLRYQHATANLLAFAASAERVNNPQNIKAYEEIGERLTQRYNDICHTIFPWQFAEGKSQSQLDADAASDLKKRWEAHFGAMDDPETQKRIQQTVAELASR